MSTRWKRWICIDWDVEYVPSINVGCGYQMGFLIIEYKYQVGMLNMYQLGYILYRFCNYFFSNFISRRLVLCTGCICGWICVLYVYRLHY